jgi:hypothetical protein
MLNCFQSFRERGWMPISAADYAKVWQNFGGSVATHPAFVERLSALAGMSLRYLGWLHAGEIVAAVPVWGRYLALSKAALKAAGKKGLFDLGNAEVCLPVKPGLGLNIPLRHKGRYLSARHEQDFAGLRRQKEALAWARPEANLSSKFRYNQRRELRLLLEAGGVARSVKEFSPAQLAAIYLDLFSRRWGFAATGEERMAEVFSLLSDWMTGSVLFLDDAPLAVQVLYRVEAPEWLSVEYVNGGVDPASRNFSPGSVLTWLNLQAAWEEAAAKGKPLRYSFGRVDREYKMRWCEAAPVFEV